MKPKTARRFLRRNKHKLAVAKLDSLKNSVVRRRFKCLTVLRHHIIETKNKASTAAYNKG